MRNFYLIVNREKPRVEEAAGLICSFFAEQGCRCIRLDRHDGLRRDAEVAAAYRYTDRRTVPEDTDCVICLGGDGTLIQAARDLAGRKIPLFGINMGHLGYLTQIGHEEDILPAMRDLMVLTPLCPHSLNSRSIVLPPDNHLSLRIQTTGRTKVSLSFDGDTVVDIEPGDTIEIAKSEIETTLIQLKQVPFLENIRNKMKQI